VRLSPDGPTGKPASDPISTAAAPAPAVPFTEDAPQQDTEMEDVAPVAPVAAADEGPTKPNGTPVTKKSSNKKNPRLVPERKSRSLNNRQSRSKRTKSKVAASNEKMADGPEEELEKTMDPEAAKKVCETEILS
jgi:hypothetical protein